MHTHALGNYHFVSAFGAENPASGILCSFIGKFVLLGNKKKHMLIERMLDTNKKEHDKKTIRV